MPRPVRRSWAPFFRWRVVSITKSPNTASACFLALSWLSANSAAVSSVPVQVRPWVDWVVTAGDCNRRLGRPDTTRISWRASPSLSVARLPLLSLTTWFSLPAREVGREVYDQLYSPVRCN